MRLPKRRQWLGPIGALLMMAACSRGETGDRGDPVSAARVADAAITTALAVAVDSLAVDGESVGLFASVVRVREGEQVVREVLTEADLDPTLSGVLRRLHVGYEADIVLCETEVPYGFGCRGRDDVGKVILIGIPSASDSAVEVPIEVRWLSSDHQGWDAYLLTLSRDGLQLEGWASMGSGH